MQLCIVFCTAPDAETARNLAGSLLENRLAACVSLLPGIESHYVWQGKRELSTEVLLKIKTSVERWPAVRDQIRRQHPYDCPEILRVDVADGLPEYCGWVIGSTTTQA